MSFGTAAAKTVNANQVAPSRAGRRPWLWFLGAVVASAIVVAALLLWTQLPDAPGDASPEAGFARDMITHHEQAVEMALIIQDRTTDPLVLSLATDIILTQTNQMGQMMGWLDIWGLPLSGFEPPMTWMGHGGQPMPGMATAEELTELRELSGAEAEIRFLQLMIDHHRGAIPMSQAVIEQSDNPVTTRLATAIINSQQNEIDIMTEMLAERGAEPLPQQASLAAATAA